MGDLEGNTLKKILKQISQMKFGGTLEKKENYREGYLCGMFGRAKIEGFNCQEKFKS